MRFHQILLYYSGLIAWIASGHPMQYVKTALPAQRDLLGIFGGADGNPVTPTLAPLAQNTLALISTAGSTPRDSASPSSSPAVAGGTMFTTSSSGIKSLSASLTRMTSSSTAPPYPDPATVTFSSVSFQIGYVADAPTTPPAELTEWKVIGIAVTTITFIATVILSVVFFDSWWGFLCAVVCGKRARKERWLGEETLVPDWEKRSWEFKLANEDGHRYPTLVSLESIVKEKERVQRDYDIKSPEVALGTQ